MTTRKEYISTAIRNGTYRIMTDEEMRKAGITCDGKEMPEGPEKEGLFAAQSKGLTEARAKLAAANGDPDIYLADATPEWLAVEVDEYGYPVK